MQVGGLIERLMETYKEGNEEVHILIRDDFSGLYTVHHICAIQYTKVNSTVYLTLNAETNIQEIANEVEEVE